jgi:hypothetical protein
MSQGESIPDKETSYYKGPEAWKNFVSSENWEETTMATK